MSPQPARCSRYGYGVGHDVGELTFRHLTSRMEPGHISSLVPQISECTVSDDIAAVLIVDASWAFATMFKEGLEEAGGYEVTIATTYPEALQVLADRHFNLAVVDLGFTDPDGGTVARRLREVQSDLRLVLIPLVGETLPPEVADLSAQGVLPKPFFLPELAGRIAAARLVPFQPVAQRTAEAVAPPAAAAPRAAPLASEPVTTAGEERFVDAGNPELSGRMTTLAQEIHAQAVILTQGGRLLAAVGQLSADKTDGLVQAVAESWHTSARIAQILGREQLRFEQSIEGGEFLFYSLAIAEDVILSTALRADVPLGMIRHRTKQAADALRSLMGV